MVFGKLLYQQVLLNCLCHKRRPAPRDYNSAGSRWSHAESGTISCRLLLSVQSAVIFPHDVVDIGCLLFLPFLSEQRCAMLVFFHYMPLLSMYANRRGCQKKT